MNFGAKYLNLLMSESAITPHVVFDFPNNILEKSKFSSFMWCNLNSCPKKE
ncbi:hypothetical protein ACPB8Q_07980 (plasmid) [Methanocaldococcus indicus]|uniref:hypothetical protein n=1 Tax=Methanocaldococcus indicus TaxID=213231 RepID=UPI003C6CE34C